MTDTMKLYDKALSDLERATKTENIYVQTLKSRIDQMKDIYNEEKIQRDEYKGF